jgi:hypothetical protein
MRVSKCERHRIGVQSTVLTLSVPGGMKLDAASVAFLSNLGTFVVPVSVKNTQPGIFRDPRSVTPILFETGSSISVVPSGGLGNLISLRFTVYIYIPPSVKVIETECF